MSKVDILLVDDRPEGLISLEAVLKNEDYNLVTASSGQEALAEVLVRDFAVILMDVQMPLMDGFETATIIKQREKSKNIPIIFMTANNRAEQYISVGYSVGAVDYVLKPFDPYILKSKVSVFVELYKKNLLLHEQAETLREVERRERLRVLRDLELEGRRRYQNLADALPQIIFRANYYGIIEYFNQYWQRYIGPNTELSLDEQWKLVAQPEDYLSIETKWNEFRKTQQGFEVECRLKQWPSGDYRWHLLRVVPEFGKSMDLPTCIGGITDIHDQKMTQQELLLAKKMADVANETKSNFLANMSHEIRTPLGVILGFCELLIDPSTTPQEKSDAINVIRKNGEQLSKIIDEILDLSKVEAGKIDLKKSEIITMDLFRTVKSFMSLPAKDKNIDLIFKVDGKIPAKIYADATRLQQILINLIGNAIKFSPKGFVQVTVSYRAEKSGEPQLVVNVLDSGPGLTAAQIENLFQPFSQVDTSMTRKHGGTGLGLALSRKLARVMGGDISVEPSKPNHGCNFVVIIPAEYPPGVEFTSNFEMVQTPSSEKLKKVSDPLKGVNVLLVEDSADNQVLVTKFLTMAGAQVDLANNGIEGVEKAMRGSHDVVLMDIQMPELDGYGAILQLRREGYQKPIIALTAHGMVEDRKKCLDIGSNGHISKPVNRETLIESVRVYSSRH